MYCHKITHPNVPQRGSRKREERKKKVEIAVALLLVSARQRTLACRGCADGDVNQKSSGASQIR
jgi:hypothetical protein